MNAAYALIPSAPRCSGRGFEEEMFDIAKLGTKFREIYPPQRTAPEMFRIS